MFNELILDKFVICCVLVLFPAVPVIIVMNIILLVRLINSDYGRTRGRRKPALSVLEPPDEMDQPTGVSQNGQKLQ
jgi:hypothetical protein